MPSFDAAGKNINTDGRAPAAPPAAAYLYPPVPYARFIRPAALAVSHFHSVLSRGAAWWGGGGGAGTKKFPASASSSRGHSLAGHSGGGDAPSAGGRGLMSMGERLGKASSSSWSSSRRIGVGGRGGGEEAAAQVIVGRKREQSRHNVFGGLSGGASGALGGGVSSLMISLDEFHANPRLRFQLLLREQGIVVQLFESMWTVRGCSLDFELIAVDATGGVRRGFAVALEASW